MSQTTDQIKWTPVLGHMNEEDVKGLGIHMLEGRTYHSLAPFGVPLILQRERGAGWSVMSKAVQERAFIGTNLRRWS
jgi:hypothetical protein